MFVPAFTSLKVAVPLKVTTSAPTIPVKVPPEIVARFVLSKVLVVTTAPIMVSCF